MKWVSRFSNSEQNFHEVFTYLCKKEKFSPFLARILIHRLGDQISDWESQLKAFLRPSLKNLSSPLTLPDIQKGLDRLLKAILSKETILIHGDYDVDGMAATTLLHSFFNQLGIKTLPFLPEREVDGYGVSKRGIDWAKDQGASLLLTCDCGVTAFEEVQYAKSIGLDVIITDHHIPSETLPPAIAVVNPNRKDSEYLFGGLSGTGVAFCFLIALRGKLREIGFFTEKIPEPDLREELDLVALATIADSVPLVQENRIFVTQGLKQMAYTKRPGIKTLLVNNGLCQKRLSTEDIAFKIIPRLNVAGRMGKPELALQLLMEEDPFQARILAEELEGLNRKRREIEKDIQDEAIKQVKKKHQKESGLVLWGEDWHQGVLGIVASKVCEKFHLPTVVISFQGEVGVGSVRSKEGVDLTKVLKACGHHLLRFGGHAQAAGLKVSKKKIKEFENSFIEYIAQNYKNQDFSPKLFVDEEIPFDCLDPLFLEQLSTLEPFGQNNPEPIFTASKVKCRNFRIVGENHLKFRLQQGQSIQDGIGFQMANRLPKTEKPMDLAFTPRWNEFRGIRTIQLQIKDWREG